MASFIQTVEGDIVAVGEAAWLQVKAQLGIFAADFLSEIKADISAVVAKVEAGATIEQLETELLNLWSNEKPALVSALTSGALQVLIAMARAAVVVL